MYDFTGFKRASADVIEWLKREYTGIRTGRATPSILDTVLVSAYGSKVPVNQVASISIEGAKSLRVVPWDKSVLQSLDSSLRESNLGLSVSVDDEGVRVSFPELSSERRTQLQKLAKDKLEEARVRIRNEREKILKDMDKSESLSKDDKFRLKNDLQKLVDESNTKLEELNLSKEREISE